MADENLITKDKLARVRELEFVNMFGESIQKLIAEAWEEFSTSDNTGHFAVIILPDWAKLLAEQLRNGEWEAAAKTLSDKLNEMVDSVDWPGLGDRMGEKMAGVLKFLATFIREFDFADMQPG